MKLARNFSKWTRVHLYRRNRISLLCNSNDPWTTINERVSTVPNRITVTKDIIFYYLQVLHKVLSSGHRRYSLLPSRAPYNLSEGASRTRSRHQLINPKRNRRAAFNASDCEDNSSGGEEEFTQVKNFFLSSFLWNTMWIYIWCFKFKSFTQIRIFFFFRYFELFCEYMNIWNVCLIF